MLAFNKTSQTFISSLLPKKFIHGFGTRMSGIGNDTKDIQKYFDSQKIGYKIIADPDQVHGDRIEILTRDYTETIVKLDNCDGLISNQAGVVLTVITADCAPILYSDIKNNIVGISHNGRKGTELKLAQKMILKLQALGSTLQDIHVAIGPAIGVCCYPMNLVKENFEQLLETGLKKDQIDFFPFCTKCDSKRFFSYRNSRNIPFGSVYAEERSAQGKPNFPEQFSFVCL